MFFGLPNVQDILQDNFGAVNTHKNELHYDESSYMTNKYDSHLTGEPKVKDLHAILSNGDNKRHSKCAQHRVLVMLDCCMNVFCFPRIHKKAS